MPRRRRRGKKKSSQPTKEELLKQIEELKAELARLREQQSSPVPKELENMFGQLMNAMNQLKEAIEAGAANAEKLINDAKSLVIAIAHDPKIARAVGYNTGINIATLQNTFQRLIEGKVSPQEVICGIENILNIAKGYFIGDQAYKEVVSGVEKAKAKASKRVSEMVDLGEGDVGG